MSTLIRRGNVYYYKWCINGKAKRKSLKTSDLATAKRLKSSCDARLLQMKTGMAPARLKVADGLMSVTRLFQGDLVREIRG